MKKLLATGLLVLGIAVYAGEQDLEQVSDRISRPAMLKLFKDYGNRF